MKHMRKQSPQGITEQELQKRTEGINRLCAWMSVSEKDLTKLAIELRQLGSRLHTLLGYITLPSMISNKLLLGCLLRDVSGQP